jgi:hypothetical protein
MERTLATAGGCYVHPLGLTLDLGRLMLCASTRTLPWVLCAPIWPFSGSRKADATCISQDIPVGATCTMS